MKQRIFSSILASLFYQVNGLFYCFTIADLLNDLMSFNARNILGKPRYRSVQFRRIFRTRFLHDIHGHSNDRLHRKGWW